MAYRVLQNSPPIKLSYPQIKWPHEWQTSLARACMRQETIASAGVSPTTNEVKHPPLSPPLSEISVNSKLSESSTLSMPTLEKCFAQRVADAEEARENLNKSQYLAAFYDKHIGRVYSPQQGQRNEHLIKIATHLFFTVGRKRALELLIIFHHLNQDIFLDPLSEHQDQAVAHMNTLEQDFLTQLNPQELAIHQQLPSPYDDAFRICRDLASHDSPDCHPPEFFISHADLGFRLDIPKGNAGRLLASLMSLGALEIVEIGRERSAGQRGRTTRYRWFNG